MLVDVHAHLSHEKFSKDLDKVLERAKKVGIKEIITSGVNVPTNREALKLSEKYDFVKTSLGLYPIDLLGLGSDESGLSRQVEPFVLEDELKFIKKNKDKIISIGEVGMDFAWDKKHHDKQKKNFEKIITFAEKLKKPIIIHSRKAEKECLDLLESSKLKKVLLHCFSGNKKLIKKGEDLGYCFSIPAIIIRLQHFQTLVEMVDMGKILTETDAPWLSPYPGKRNEPSFIVETIKKITEIKKLTKEEVEKIIFMNYKRFFL
ncbi:hypothetical protein CL621_02325 [archaeon]|nr:hypothetical protein [archaeon]